MKKQYDVFYNDSAYYGTLIFNDKTQLEIEKNIQKEIDDNNKNVNHLYHISRENFKEVLIVNIK